MNTEGRPGDDKNGASTTLYTYYVLGILTLAFTISFIDRIILSLVVDPVRKDLALTETEFSLLIGFAFAIFYTLLGLPIGRIVDSRSRRNIIVIGMMVWSVATVFCGLAKSFWGLFVPRMAVGAGEATLFPASVSMVSDLLPPHQRGFGISMLSVGASIGGGLAMVLGGYIVEWAMAAKPFIPFLGQIAPWKVAFIAAGLPGILIALLFLFTIKEPKRVIEAGSADRVPSFGEVGAYLWTHRKMYALVMLGFAGFVIDSYCFLSWGPAFYMRLHGMSPAQAGWVLAIAFGAGGVVTISTAGILADKLTKKGYWNSAVLVSLWTAIPPIPLFLVAYLSSNTYLSIAAFLLAVFIAVCYGGLQGAALQAITPNRMRGQVIALYVVLVNIMGLGVAPTVTAIMTQYVFGGELGIGKSLAVTTVFALSAAAVLLFLALKPAAARAAALAGVGSRNEESPG